jgi:hypothetical protein
MADRFRQTTLTVLGAIGYVAFLGAAAAKTLGYPVTWEIIGVILLTSSALLGVDFGLDVIPRFVQNRDVRTGRDKQTDEGK